MIILRVFFLFNLFITFAHAQVTTKEARHLFNEAKILLENAGLNSKNLEIQLTIQDEKKGPGAFARWEKKNKLGEITLTKELLDLEKIDKKTLSVFLCHEFGHFLGGEPTVKVEKPPGVIFTFKNPFENLSAEGQADFFAIHQCLIPLFTKFKFNSEELEQNYLNQCDDTKIDRNICYAVMNSIYKTSKIYQFINHEFYDHYEEFDTLSNTKTYVDETLNKPGQYPSLQCRYQTMMNSLQCFFDDSCVQDEMKPTCWFKNP